jgi:hypothetical protein
MQVERKDFNEKEHTAYRALTVKQSFASDLVNVAYKDEKGVTYGAKSIEVRSRRTAYRGRLLICSSQKPVYPNLDSGCVLGFVELYDVKRVEDFTPEDWDKTRIPRARRAEIKTGWGWLMRNPVRCVELPVKGQLGIYNIYFGKDDIVEYPRICKVSYKDWLLLQKPLEDKL